MRSVRRVIVIAYFFPPLGGGGVQRALAFVRYLPRFGWQPVVVAPRDPGYEIRDEDLSARIPPDVDVRRSTSPEPWWPVFRGLQRFRRRIRRPAGASGTAPLAGAERRSVRLAAHLFFPDEHLTWLPFAVWSAIRSGRRAPASAIVSTSPPITGHLIAGVVAPILRVPWIADFRDPWIGNVFGPRLAPPHRWLQARIERWIVHRASRVTAATPTLARSLQTRYPGAAERIVALCNGYDGEEIASLPRRPADDDRFRLVYTGSVYAGGLGPFLEGLEAFAEAHPQLAERIRVEFMGWLDRESAALAERFGQSSPAGHLVAFSGHRPRREAMAAVAGANAALHLLGDGPARREFIGGKLYEYIGIGVPVLAVVPPGDARWVLESLDWGIVADPTPAGVSDGLYRLLMTPRDQWRGPADPTGRFDRRNLTGELARLLDEVSAPA